MATNELILTDEQKQIFLELMKSYLTSLSSMPADNWSEQARAWCKENKIINPDNENPQWKRFATREELALLLYTFEKELNKE